MNWCTGRGIVPFHAEVAAVVPTWSTWPSPASPSVESACSAIGNQRHRARRVPDSVDHNAVRRVRKGLRRILGREPRRPAHPLSVDELRQILPAIDRYIRPVQALLNSSSKDLGF